MVAKNVLDRLCDEFGQEREHIVALLDLLAGGAAPLFIARYRKETIGAMPLAGVLEIERRFRFLDLLERRKERFFEDQARAGKEVDPKLAEAIRETFDPLHLDDLTRTSGPRPSRRRREKRDSQPGPDPARVEGLIAKIRTCDLASSSLVEAALEYVDARIGLLDAQSVLDFTAEEMARQVAEDSEIMERTRAKLRQGVLFVRAAEPQRRGADRFRELVGLREPLHRIPSGKFLGILRGARERHLLLEILVDQVPLLDHLERKFFPGLQQAPGELRRFIQDVVRRGMIRQILPAAQDAVLEEHRDRKARESVAPLQRRLRSLIMAPPFPGQTVLAVDPDLRKGNRMVVADPRGSFLDDGLFFIAPDEKRAEARVKVREFLEKYGVTFIAVAAARGEGREVKAFLRETVQDWSRPIPVETVGDAGARSWASSPAASKELPDVEVEVRAVLSLARRVLDPLAEYVKIDPALIVAAGPSLDIPPRMLRSALGEVIETCVAEVGPDVNFAPPEVLAHVPGLDSRIGREIETRRATPFKGLEQLTDLESVSDRVFRNCAGFLRIHHGEHPLDVTQIHPERYDLVRRMAQKAEVSVADLLGNREKIEAIPLQDYLGDGVGLPTLEDIRADLLRHGVDPRGTFELLEPPAEVKSLEDLKVEMKLQGRITRVADFGIFVDVGVEPEGLVHESRIPSDQKECPLEGFTVGQLVEVRVVHVDVPNRRLALSMLPEGASPGRRPPREGVEGGPEGQRPDGQRPEAGRRDRPRRGRGDREGPRGPERPREGQRTAERGSDRPRGGDRDRGADRGADRWRGPAERVIKARPVAGSQEPLRTSRGELTSLSDLRSLLAPKQEPEHNPAPLAEPAQPPVAEPEPQPQTEAESNPEPTTAPTPVPEPTPEPAPETTSETPPPTQEEAPPPAEAVEQRPAEEKPEEEPGPGA